MSRIGVDVNTDDPVVIDEDAARTAGVYVLGKSGMGKSSLLSYMARCDSVTNGLFFLDPHGETIRNLEPYLWHDTPPVLLNVQDKERSFGINLVACQHPNDLTERSNTYTRAYNVFHKIFRDERGELSPWLQLILQYAIYVFIENQGYTLAELPLFLTDRGFREYLLQNIKHHPDAVTFWRHEFDPVQAQAAMTRIRILLGDTYVSHIIGQETTLDFADVLANNRIVLMSLSANLSEDVKKFIGVIVLDELLHAVRNRPEDNYLPNDTWKRRFGIYIDEMHNFVSSEDIGTLITEGRKYGVMFVGCHQERYGQLTDNRKIAGATLATVNKVFFQLSVADAQEVAPELAPTMQQAQTPVQTVISPHAVEAIWDQGHPSEYVMDVRSRSFHVVELLRTAPTDGYYTFNPRRAVTHEENRGNLHYEAFDDWGMYRATPEMLREGIALLNRYYYNYMHYKPFLSNGYKHPLKTNKELELFRKTIDCLGGVLGFRPAMQGYISPEMRQLFIKKMNQKYDRDMRDYQQWWEHGGGKEAASLTMYPGPWAMNRPSQLDFRMRKDHPEWFDRDWVTIMPTFLNAESQIKDWRAEAVEVGFTQGELDNFIQWQPRGTFTVEEEVLTELIRVVADIQADKAEYNKRYPELYRKYIAIMSLELMKERLGPKHADLPMEKVKPYMQVVTDRIHWQLAELQVFIQYIFNMVPVALERDPVTGPSTNYAATHKREFSSADLVGEMVKELVSLPKFTAYAKVLGETGSEIHKMRPNPLSGFPKRVLPYDREIPEVTRARSDIVQAMQQRQTQWRQQAQPQSPKPHPEPSASPQTPQRRGTKQPPPSVI